MLIPFAPAAQVPGNQIDRRTDSRTVCIFGQSASVCGLSKDGTVRDPYLAHDADHLALGRRPALAATYSSAAAAAADDEDMLHDASALTSTMFQYCSSSSRSTWSSNLDSAAAPREVRKRCRVHQHHLPATSWNDSHQLFAFRSVRARASEQESKSLLAALKL